MGAPTALSEAQIQRYSRQILLKDLGGVGQRRLLGAAVAVVGEGPALETAARYLAAGGTPVRGLLLAPFDPELDQNAPLAVTISTGPGRITQGAQVAIVASNGAVRILYKSALGCARCFEALAHGDGVTHGAQATTAGALAALLSQRLILEKLSGVGGLSLAGNGELSEVLAACDHAG